MMERKLTKRERETCEINCVFFDALFAAFKKCCANPYCSYPLRPMEGHNFIPEYGEVCELCHWMFYAAKRQPGLEWAHEQYAREQARKRKILDSINY